MKGLKVLVLFHFIPILVGMGVKNQSITVKTGNTPNPIELDYNLLIRAYNEMNFREVVNLYTNIKYILPGIKPKSEIVYILANSLYRTSNHSEVLIFTNFSIEDTFLSNSVMLLVAFSLSELKNFEDSDRILLSITNQFFLHYSDLIEYYKFRNNLFRGSTYIPKGGISKFFKNDDISKIAEVLNFSDNDDFAVFTSKLVVFLRRHPTINTVVEKLTSRKYSNRQSIILVSKNLIQAGFIPDGAKLILKIPLPNPVRDYYNALLHIEDRQYDKAKNIITSLISNYEDNKKILKTYDISLDDILILNLRLYSNISSKEFNRNAMKYMKVGGVKFHEYVLRNYRILEKEVHLSFTTNYFSKVSLTYSTKVFLSAFISHQFHRNNIEEIKKLSSFMLKRTKNTSWEKEFLLLDFLLENSRKKRLEIAKEIILKYPFTYEYISLLNYIERETNSYTELILDLVDEYEKILSRYLTNRNIADLNSLIGIKFIADRLNLELPREFNLLDEVYRFRPSLLSLHPVLTNESTNTNTDESVNTNLTKPLREYSHIENAFSKGLILDVQLEIRKILPRADIRYLKEFKRYGMTDYSCKCYEGAGLERDRIFSKRAVAVLAFLEELYPTPFLDRVEKYSLEYKVPRETVFAVMRQESKYSPYVVSVANAIGLMQLILTTAETTAKRFKITSEDTSYSHIDVFAIDNNIRLGIAHLSELIQAFSKYPPSIQEQLIVSSYNAGMTVVRKWYESLKTDDGILFVEGIRFHETREYTKIVIENKFIYQNFIFGNYLLKNSEAKR